MANDFMCYEEYELMLFFINNHFTFIVFAVFTVFTVFYSDFKGRIGGKCEARNFFIFLRSS